MLFKVADEFLKLKGLELTQKEFRWKILFTSKGMSHIWSHFGGYLTLYKSGKIHVCIACAA